MYICIWILRTLIEPLRKLLNKEYIMHMQKNCCSMNCAMHISMSQKMYPINKSQHGLNTPWKLWSFRTRLSHSRKESWDTNETVPRLFVTDSQADRDFMQILISLTKAEKRTIMDTLFVASTYWAQSVTGWRSFRTFFFFSAVPYTRSLFLTTSLARSVRFPIFSLSFFPILPSWQLVEHIWPVISKMSNKIMHRTSVRVPRSHEIKVA